MRVMSFMMLGPMMQALSPSSSSPFFFLSSFFEQQPPMVGYCERGGWEGRRERRIEAGREGRRESMGDADWPCADANRYLRHGRVG